MRKILVLIVFAFFTSFAFAQSDYHDVVYLKNGSIIHGIIIEQIPNKSIKLETFDGNVFVYQIDEVEKFTKERFINKGGYFGYSGGLERGYKGIVDLGYQIGVGENGLDRIKLNFINGFQANPYISVGIGTGFRIYLDESDGILIPLFADFRVNFIDNKISPYFALGIGYSFDLNDSFGEGGFLMNPTLGCSFRISEENTVNVGLEYELQNIIYKYDSYGYTGEYSESTGALCLSLGMTF